MIKNQGVIRMSSYTMTLGEIIDDLTTGEYYEDNRQKIEIGRKKLFNFDYPIFDKDYKTVFETNFIRHFYMREIGFETDGLFKFQLESWLRIHMPYFNKMFESELIDFNPLENSSVDVTAKKINDRNQTANRNTNQSMTNQGESDSVSNTTNDTDVTSTDDNFKRELTMNTPDSRLTITANDGEGVIEYASGIQEENENNENKTKGNEKATGTSKTTDSATTESESADDMVANINDVEDYIQHRGGKIGVQSYSDMLMKFRKSFIRIEQDIFKEMQQLFMLVY